MSEQPYVDPGHRVPDEQWGAVVRYAKAERLVQEARHGTPEPPADLVEMARPYLEGGA